MVEVQSSSYFSVKILLVLVSLLQYSECQILLGNPCGGSGKKTV